MSEDRIYRVTITLITEAGSPEEAVEIAKNNRWTWRVEDDETGQTFEVRA